ncbi:DnaD domain-containing protein [Carnobacterium funditum]|uniref:DnaD domain-containing protein n=1 Tax=Carnobacterium funditum TaxID=2752 RepID=UPI0005542259|nr:DnaD domain-containing protein [Carnobacterium funditum]
MDNQLLKEWLAAGNTTISNILLRKYRDIGLTNEQLVLLLQLKSYLDSGIFFPDTEEIAKRMGISSADAFQGIHDLIQKNVLTIETEKNSEGKTNDRYSLSLLWDKLALLLVQTKITAQHQEQQIVEKDLYQHFESEFGRALSPIEIQTIGMWLDDDKYSIELIEMALREAVLSQVYNLKYVDRILLNWERKNIRSKAQVEKEAQSRRQKNGPETKRPTDKKSGAKVPLHNWLNDSN